MFWALQMLLQKRGRNRFEQQMLGPMLRTIPPDASTLAGDITLAVLADVFVGNPVSSISQFIAQARYALGTGNSYLFMRRRGGGGEEGWETFCHDEECFYRLQDLYIQCYSSCDISQVLV